VEQVVERSLPATLNDEGQRIFDLMKRIDKGKPKPEDVLALREALDKTPGLWRVTGDVFGIAMDALVNSQTNQVSVRESMKRGVEVVKAQLGYKTASGAERLLIEACALGWLQYYLIEFRYVVVSKGDQSINQANYWEKKLALAQHRYLKAIETLARVRRLAVPVMQLNVAEAGAKQLNVAQAGADHG
jgi:hypothetical protein